MFFRILCVILTVAVLFGVAVLPAEADGIVPSVSAKGAVLIDAGDGRVLYERNAHLRLPMASTTKIMTAIVAIEAGNLDETVKISQDAVGVEGSSIYLTEGESLSLRELLYAVMLASANDAAAAVAIHIGGSVEGFAELMNQKAVELGCSDTHFCNPHGLDAKEHYTSALDLARITAYALKNETFAKIASTVKQEITGVSETKRYLVNHNRLLREYDGSIGVKTGFTKTSGRCLVSAAERNGLMLVAVTLSDPNDWRDHKNLLDYGFEFYRSVTLCRAGDNYGKVGVVSGEPGEVSCVTAKEVTLTLLSHGGEIEMRIERDRFLWEMPYDGERLGRVVFYRDGKELAETELIAKTSGVEQKENSFLDFIRKIFGK